MTGQLQLVELTIELSWLTPDTLSVGRRGLVMDGWAESAAPQPGSIFSHRESWLLIAPDTCCWDISGIQTTGTWVVGCRASPPGREKHTSEWIWERSKAARDCFLPFCRYFPGEQKYTVFFVFVLFCLHQYLQCYLIKGHFSVCVRMCWASESQQAEKSKFSCHNLGEGI